MTRRPYSIYILIGNNIVSKPLSGHFSMDLITIVRLQGIR